MHAFNVKIETIAAVSATLACRHHDFSDVTSKTIQEEVHAAKTSVQALMRRFNPPKPESVHITSSPEDCHQRKGKFIANPVTLGEIVIPSGRKSLKRDRFEKKKGNEEEIFRIIDSQTALVSMDPLLGEDFDALFFSQPVLPLPPTAPLALKPEKTQSKFSKKDVQPPPSPLSADDPLSFLFT